MIIRHHNKRSLLIVLAAISLTVSAQSQFTQPTRTFLMHSSGLHLKRASDGIAKLEAASATKPQQVTFVPVGGGYYVVRADGSRSYMALSGDWETHFVTDSTSDNAKWKIERQNDFFVKLRCTVGSKETGIKLIDNGQLMDNGGGFWYSVNGSYMGTSSEGLAPGIYVVKQGNVCRKVLIKN